MTCLVCFTMDNLSDAADLGRGRIAEPRQPGERPALEIGYPALLEMYEKYNVSITHFVEGWNGDRHQQEIQRLLDGGHTLGMHGWLHEKWSELDEDTEYELAAKSTDALAEAVGKPPTAFRAPGGGRTAATAGILNSLGYTIDASLAEDGSEGGPVSNLTDTLWNVPYLWSAVDAPFWLWDDTSLAETERQWRELLQSRVGSDEFVVFIWHPHIMGIDQGRREVGHNILQMVTASLDFKVVTLEELVALKSSDTAA